MYHPTTRVLTVLELLQSHQRMTGPDLAARLEVNVRTARRYITMLQDMGIPIEAERGRHGAYRLRPSFKLPPLMLSGDEALAVTLGLLIVRKVGLASAAPAAEGALAKIERVLPPDLREQLQAVQASLVLDLLRADGPLPSAAVVTLSGAAQDQRQVRIGYRAERGEASERVIDPYGLVYRQGRWYVVGYCHMRDGMRVFRLDRIAAVELLESHFERPADFDCAAYVVRSIASAPSTWPVEVIFKAPPELVHERVAPVMGTLAQCADGVLMTAYADNLAWMARELVALGLPLSVRQPPELRTELRKLAESIVAMAE
jgi:predicted DNA-binding transcriptional regulator YafY